MIRYLVLITALVFIGAFTTYADAPSGEEAFAWTATDTALQAIFIAATAVDWSQTLDISRSYERRCPYYERNPFLGRKPGAGRINTWMSTTILAHTAIAYLLPKPYRTVWQSLWVGLEIGQIHQNRQIGLGVDLHF
jgi:hypothetical protein